MHMKLHFTVELIALGLCTVGLVGQSAHAQEDRTPETTRDNPLEELYACSSIIINHAKSECYDRATKNLQLAESLGQILTLNADEIKDIQQGVFGYKYTPFTSGKNEHLKAPTLNTVTVPVKKVERYLSGYVITLDNNQVWEQFAGSIPRVPKGKLSAEIKTTPTGTYKMVLFNAKSKVSNIRVRRIQ